MYRFKNKRHYLLLIFQKTLRELFPRLEVILKHKDVLSLAYGLSDHPGDVIDLICDKGGTYFAENVLKESEQQFQQDADKCYRQTHVILYHIDELIRKVKAEKTEKDTPKQKTFNIQNGYLSVCSHDRSDLFLSRMYVVREVGSLFMAFICPDPVREYDHGDKNDPARYVISNPCGNHFFGRLVKIIQMLTHHHKIVITRIYSPDIRLIEKDSNLEGHLALNVSTGSPNIFSIITEIEHLKLQTIFFTDLKLYSGENGKVDVSCFEKVRRSLLGSNIKALRFVGFKLPSWLIEHIEQELYGKTELQISGLIPSNVTTVPTPTQQSATGSSLQILSFVSNLH